MGKTEKDEELKIEATDSETEDWLEFAKWTEESKIPVVKKEEEPVDYLDDYEGYDSISGT